MTMKLNAELEAVLSYCFLCVSEFRAACELGRGTACDTFTRSDGRGSRASQRETKRIVQAVQ